jgi:hypothetical protein
MSGESPHRIPAEIVIPIFFSSAPGPSSITSNGGVANPQHFGGLLDGQPAEKLSIDDSFLLGIDDGQFLQSFMQGQQIQDRLSGRFFPAQLTGAGDRESLLFPIRRVLRLMLAGMINQMRRISWSRHP